MAINEKNNAYITKSTSIKGSKGVLPKRKALEISAPQLNGLYRANGAKYGKALSIRSIG